MFFEATYVPSPPLSATSLDNDIPNGQLEENSTVLNENYSGFEDIEPTSDKPVDHLIFVIHGIGQQTEQYGHFYEHIENLQETTRQVLQAKVPDHNVRIELIPIEWHRHIHEQVDPIINKITLKSIPTIRLIENDYLADVLFYFSKDRGQNIVNNVTSLFNTSYHNFIEKHPDFDGKIIIMGYSLGGIITWDILSHQREPQTKQEIDMYSKLDVNFSKLDFKPHYFFGLGSPIGAVLTFRGQDPTLYHPDFDIKFENVFHPFDPLGYRFEPLFHDSFTDKPAVLVERSVPIGPSFSFPSMPSFPLSAGFLSFFSWKQEEKGVKTIYDTTSEAADAGTNENTTLEDNKQIPRQEGSSSSSSSSGFMSSLFQYFSRGGGTVINDTNNYQRGELDKDNSNNQNNVDLVDGIITWDPLREQTREQLLALRDDLDRTLNSRSMDNVLQPKRPSIKIRSKTYGNTTPAGSIYSSSLEQNSDGSVLTINNKMSSGLDMIGEEKQPERIALRKTMTEHQPKRQHLVEVLGIDGVRVDSFERARINFDKRRVKSTDETHKKDTEDTELNADGGDNLWLDLNKELHKPGPALTSPGESRAEVAQNDTVPKSSDNDQLKSTSADTEEEEQEYINLLPGKHRMDFVLQPDSVMSMIANEYLIGLRAHFSYWTNKDFIWHMLRRIENLENCETKKKNDKKKASSMFLTGEDKSNVSLASTTVSNSENSTIVSIDDSNIAKKSNKK